MIENKGVILLLGRHWKAVVPHIFLNCNSQHALSCSVSRDTFHMQLWYCQCPSGLLEKLSWWRSSSVPLVVFCKKRFCSVPNLWTSWLLTDRNSCLCLPTWVFPFASQKSTSSIVVPRGSFAISFPIPPELLVRKWDSRNMHGSCWVQFFWVLLVYAVKLLQRVGRDKGGENVLNAHIPCLSPNLVYGLVQLTVSLFFAA